MTTEEWNNLAATLAESWKQSGAPVSTAGTQVSGESVEQIVRQVAETVTGAETLKAENQKPSSSGSNGSTSRSISTSDSAGGVEVLKTIGMVTGIGPVATALVKLFGGGSDDRAELPVPVRYTLPPALQVSAGLNASRSLSQVNYAQNDRVRAEEPVTGTRDSAPVAPAPQSIQIHVNAMDSQSFMDHSDEIAQAVRAAMLRSHALNDVVSEV